MLLQALKWQPFTASRTHLRPASTATLVLLIVASLACSSPTQGAESSQPEIVAPLTISGSGSSNGPPFRLPSGDFLASSSFSRSACSIYLELRHARMLEGHEINPRRSDINNSKSTNYIYGILGGRYYIYASVYSYTGMRDEDCHWTVTLEHLP